jgi:hypothetical protein
MRVPPADLAFACGPRAGIGGVGVALATALTAGLVTDVVLEASGRSSLLSPLSSAGKLRFLGSAATALAMAFEFLSFLSVSLPFTVAPAADRRVVFGSGSLTTFALAATGMVDDVEVADVADVDDSTLPKVVVDESVFEPADSGESELFALEGEPKPSLGSVLLPNWPIRGGGGNA